MKRTLVLLLALVLVAGMLPPMTLTARAASQWDTDGDGVLEILAIGNSFSVDALEYAYQIAGNLGIEEIAIGNLYIGGCSLATHNTNAQGDLAKYTYYFNDTGSWTSTGSYKISTALASRSWDYVSLQQASNYSGVESTYNEDLTNLIAYVQERSDAKLVWHMTWAYQQDSTHSAFPTYGKDQMTMYNAIVSAVQNKIVTNSGIDLIVPNGTAVQNSRTSLLGDTTTRDGYHMSYTYGRYLTGLMFVKTVTGLSVDGVTYTPSGVDAQAMTIAKESVNNAAAQPFAVTKSAYSGDLPEEGYVLLKPALTKGGYWHPLKVGQYNIPVTNASNSASYFATIRFTRDTLPVGSIIVLESGWQYRPDGWITDALQTGTREPVTTSPYVVVTDAWWGDYTIRGFNISKVGTPSIMDLTADDIHQAFRIYVPEEKHTHINTSAVTAPTCTAQGYTTHTCTLCGESTVDSYADELGHRFDSGACQTCGSSFPAITAAMAPEKNLSMTFSFDAGELAGGGHYALITHGSAEIRVEQTDWADGSFTYNGIAAKALADEIAVTIFSSGDTAVSQVYQCSARDVLMAQLETETNPLKQTLLVDTLNYGTAAQEYFGYNTADLANKSLTPEQQALATGDVTAADGRVKGTGYAGSTLALGNTIKLNFVFNNSAIQNAAKAVFTYTPAGGGEDVTFTLSSTAFTRYSSTRKRLTVEIPVLQAAQLVKCSIQDADGKEITSASDSVESYIARSAASNDLYEAILKYTRSASAYLGSQ